MVPKNDKKWNMAHVQYTYMVAYVYHSMSFALYECLQGRPCHNCWQSVSLLDCVYLMVETRQCRFLCSLWWVPYAFEVLHSFYRNKRNPFSSSLVFAESLTCVFFSVSGKSQDSPNTAPGADRKVLFGGENKVFWCWSLSPQITVRKERCTETIKGFYYKSFLADLDCSWRESALHVW